MSDDLENLSEAQLFHLEQWTDVGASVDVGTTGEELPARRVPSLSLGSALDSARVNLMSVHSVATESISPLSSPWLRKESLSIARESAR